MAITRIINALEEYEKKGNNLSKYQIQLKKLILLASKDKDFSELLYNVEEDGLLKNIEEYNNPDIQNEYALNRWLGIQNDSPEEEHNKLVSIHKYWLVYLAFMGHKHSDGDKRQKITDTFGQKIKGYEEKIKKSEKKLEEINAAADILSQSQVLPAYAKNEDNNSEKHNKAARTWLIWLIITIATFVPIVWLTYEVTLPEFAKPISDSSDGTLQFVLNSGLAMKFLIVIAWIFIVKFISKNYYAEKHLKQIALHRSSVLRSLHAVYENIQDQQEKDNLIKTGALVAFQAYETGYISRKEGAGETKVGLSDLLKQ